VKTLYTGAAILCGVNLAADVQAMQVNAMKIVNVDSKQTPADLAMGESPNGQVSLLPEDAKATDEASLFGDQGGYFHANLMIQEEYTDNLYNINDKTSTFITKVAPTLWFTLPRKKEIPVSIASNNTSPGGLALQLKDYEGTDRYQAYALGGLEFDYYSENSDLNTVNGLAEGLYRYNMRGGLSLQLVDRYSRDQDKYDAETVLRDTKGHFDSNIVLTTADWKMTEKLRAKVEYSNFWLSYVDKINDFKDRVDNVFDLYGYYIYSEKTSLFLEGKFVDVKYDVTTVDDNTQKFIYGGIKWDTTEKISLMAKAGLQDKAYDNNIATAQRRESYSGLALDVQGSYKITEKTGLSLDLYRTNEETDSTVASDKTVLGATLGYKQKFTQKITGTVAVTFEDADYTQLIEQDRQDTTFAVQPAAQYLFRDWLLGEISYKFEKRDSTDDQFDYETNTIFANVKFAI
jgi:hypothetical protein